MLRGFIVGTFTESEAGLWIPVRETQRKKRGKRLCKARNVGARERESDSGVGLGLSQTIKAPYVPLLPSLISTEQHRVFQLTLYHTAIKIHLNWPFTLQPGMYRHTYVHTLAASHMR